MGQVSASSSIKWEFHEVVVRLAETLYIKCLMGTLTHRHEFRFTFSVDLCGCTVVLLTILPLNGHLGHFKVFTTVSKGYTPSSILHLQQTYVACLANSPNNKDTTHISRQLQSNSWDVIGKRCQSSWQECVSKLHNRQPNVWEAHLGNPHRGQVREMQPMLQGNLGLKGGFRKFFFFFYRIHSKV